MWPISADILNLSCTDVSRLNGSIYRFSLDNLNHSTSCGHAQTTNSPLSFHRVEIQLKCNRPFIYGTFLKVIRTQVSPPLPARLTPLPWQEALQPKPGIS